MALEAGRALFAGHDEGGKTWGRITSLIETCKINSVEPFAYRKRRFLPTFQAAEADARSFPS